jgi:hypothetical protein
MMQSYILKLHVFLSVRAFFRHCLYLFFFFFFDEFCFLCQVNCSDLCFFFFDEFCFLCQLNWSDLCFFFFLMSFVFCDSYYSTGALCTKFTLVDIESFVSVFIIVKCMPWNDEMCGIVVECIVKL